MRHSFNLVDEGFIPCICADGSRAELGLNDALLQAHAIREIRDESPMVTIALHRLLLAILHRALAPGSLDDWKAIWRPGRFEAGAIATYFDRWHSRLDLLDEHHPFFQTPGVTQAPLPICALFEDQSCGNNPTLFSHGHDEAPQLLSLAVVARGIIGRQAFSIGFGKSPDWQSGGRTIKTGYRTDGPLVRGLTLLLRGDSLFETLILNLVPAGAGKNDSAAWERDDLLASQRPAGVVDLFTWQTRRLGVEVPDPLVDGVASIHFAQGRTLAKDFSGDPMKAYRKDKTKGWQPHALRPDRALWRDSSVLLRWADDDPATKPVEALNLVAKAVDAGCVEHGRTIRMDAFGVSTEAGKAGKVTLWRHETLPLPIPYLREAVLVDLLGQALEAAEGVGRALWSATRVAAKELLGRGADRGRVNDLTETMGAERTYWPGLEMPFLDLLGALPSAAPAGQALVSRWVLRAVCPCAEEAYERAGDGLGGSARLLRAIALGREDLQRKLGAMRTKHREVLDDQDR